MGEEQSFNKIQNCLLNLSPIKPFECLVLDMKESKIFNYLELEILLNGIINNEFLLKKDLFLEMENKKNNIIKVKEDENLSLKNPEDERSEIKNENKISILKKEKKTRFYIIINELKGIVINNQLYCEILQFSKKEKEIADSDAKKKKYFHFIKSIYLDSNSSLYIKNEKTLFSIYLKSLNDKDNKFEDSNKTIINLNKELDSNKAYFFTNLFYNPDKKIISFVEKISKYEEINSSLTRKSSVFKVNKKEKRIFRGKVIKAYFSDNKIQVKIENENEKDKIVDIQLNHKLIKDITFNGENYFINFKTDKENKFIFKTFSHIIKNEKTILEIEFLDFKKENKYNFLKINEEIIKIISKTLRIELITVPDKNYFREKLAYMFNNKEIHSFIVEIYKGRINKFYSFLNLDNDGYYYEFLYIAKKEENLMINQKVNLDIEGNIFMYFNELEKFENKLKGRICIINIPKQIINKNDLHDELENNSFKYLFLIQENNKVTIVKFVLKMIKFEKYEFYIGTEFEKSLNNFYNIYKENIRAFIKDSESIKKKYNLLFQDEESPFENKDKLNDKNIHIINEDSDSENEFLIEEEEYEIVDKEKLYKISNEVIEKKNNYRKYIELSFKKYNFKNSQTQFEQIKKLCFLYIIKYKCFKRYKLDNTNYLEINGILDNFNCIIKSSENLEYIDRIRILLSFTNNRIFDNDYNDNDFKTYLINLNNNDLTEECSYLISAYKILYQILDNLDESSSFFIALHQLNSYIENDYYFNNRMYSSSILTVNDVKLDFIRNNHGYFFINNIKNIRTFAYYCPYSKLIFYNPYVFISPTKNKNIFKLENDNFEKKATCASLFLSFHEDCGHLKNDINNIEDTPRQFYNSNLVVEVGGVPKINDAGYIFEYFLNEKVIHPKYLMKSKNISDIDFLLDYKYYIKSDFNEIRKKLDNISTKKKKKIKLIVKKKKGEIEDDDYKQMKISYYLIYMLINLLI